MLKNLSSDDLSISENVYGHLKRLNWIIRNVGKDQTIIELGCGTGVMITTQLLILGYDAYGIDLDAKSVNFGKDLLDEIGLDSDRLMIGSFGTAAVSPDVVIASEVFEHISTNELGPIFTEIKQKLAPGGCLLVTVPNGYGWFEFESLLWFKMHIGIIMEKLQITRFFGTVKKILIGPDYEAHYPSTLSTSTHLQRFTLSSISKLISQNDFRINNVSGSAFFAGPFSNMCFTGCRSFMKINNWLGFKFPRLSSGFYLVAEAKLDHE